MHFFVIIDFYLTNFLLIIISYCFTTTSELQFIRFEELTEHSLQCIIREYYVLEQQSKDLLKTAMEHLNLSARAYDRILKVARTIADLDAAPQIVSSHIAEAIQYRSLDRDGWLG